MLELANMMIRIFGLNCQPDIIEPRPGDIRYSCANTDKMRSFLNLVPDDELEPYLKNLAAKVYQEGKCSN